LGKDRRRKDGQQARDSQKRLHFTIPVNLPGYGSVRRVGGWPRRHR
jgi:hypothetical protein